MPLGALQGKKVYSVFVTDSEAETTTFHRFAYDSSEDFSLSFCSNSSLSIAYSSVITHHFG